jgi:hypothetical protein
MFFAKQGMHNPDSKNVVKTGCFFKMGPQINIK